MYTLNSTEVHAICYGICGYHSNAMMSDNPHSGIYEASDMFVTEKRHGNELGWHSDSTYVDAEQCRGVRECLIKKTLML